MSITTPCTRDVMITILAGNYIVYAAVGGMRRGAVRCGALRLVATMGKGACVKEPLPIQGSHMHIISCDEMKIPGKYYDTAGCPGRRHRDRDMFSHTTFFATQHNFLLMVKVKSQCQRK